jgi:hypothetical protein
MGTRGLFGFRYKGKYYLFYNHWDSYITGLGADIISQIKEAIDHNRLEEWKEKVLLFEIVNDDIEPTAEQIERLKPFNRESSINERLVLLIEKMSRTASSQFRYWRFLRSRLYRK